MPVLLITASPLCLSFAHWCLSCSALLCLILSPSPPSRSGLYPRPFMFSAVPVPSPPGVNIEEHIQIRQEEKRQRINRRHRLEEGRGMDKGWWRVLLVYLKFGGDNQNISRCDGWLKSELADLRYHPFDYFTAVRPELGCCVLWGLPSSLLHIFSVSVYCCDVV